MFMGGYVCCCFTVLRGYMLDTVVLRNQITFNYIAENEYPPNTGRDSQIDHSYAAAM